MFIMFFNIDDIYNLTIMSRRQIKEFNIETFNDVCIENEKLLEELFFFSMKKLEEITNENIALGMRGAIKNSLLRAYRQQKTIKPKEEFAKIRIANDRVGYFKDHPDAEFIEKRYRDLCKVYSAVIEFLNKLYAGIKVSNKKKVNPKPIVDMFEQTKKVCSRLGIRCFDEDSLYEMFTNPNGQLAINEDLDFEIVEKNEISGDIEILSIPYDFAAPWFDASKGLELYRCRITQGKAFYSKTYMNKQDPISFS